MKTMLQKYIFAVFIFFSLFSLSQSNSSQETHYYFIRHAEKNRGDNVGKNPSLNKQGKKRAESWSVYFKDIEFDAIYATSYNRTIQTAKPTAKAKNLKIKTYDPNALYSKQFQEETKEKKVLVVGHSNTTPAFVNHILKENYYAEIDDKTNSHLYIVKILDGTIDHNLLIVN